MSICALLKSAGARNLRMAVSFSTRTEAAAPKAHAFALASCEGELSQEMTVLRMKFRRRGTTDLPSHATHEVWSEV